MFMKKVGIGIYLLRETKQKHVKLFHHLKLNFQTFSVLSKFQDAWRWEILGIYLLFGFKMIFWYLSTLHSFHIRMKLHFACKHRENQKMIASKAWKSWTYSSNCVIQFFCINQDDIKKIVVRLFRLFRLLQGNLEVIKFKLFPSNLSKVTLNS